MNNAATRIETAVENWQQRLLDIGPEATFVVPSPGRWSIADVVGHLVDSACNNHQRFVRAQNADALIFPKYDQNAWVAAANYSNFDWPSLVSLWALYNRMLANLIRNIRHDDLQTPCTIGPNEACTLEFLVTDYVDHLDHHLTVLRNRLN